MIGYCHRHDVKFDTDWHECCPTCEAMEIEVTQAENGWSAHFTGVPDDRNGAAWSYATTEDEAVSNLLRIA